jgi:hypothetical protein
MLWAVTHQLESLSNVGRDVMSTNLNLIPQSRILYYDLSNEKIEFMPYLPVYKMLSFLSRIHPNITLSAILKVCDVHTVNIYFSYHGAPYIPPVSRVILRRGGTFDG